MTNAKIGDFIKDLSPMKRSLGLVRQVDDDTGLMLVQFPKQGAFSWVVVENNGHYVVIKK
ncbi:hypothetical protein CMI47_08365 [Candidatus Pacearchaeota archaeon]|nr:hypothetical protein [Candidatus Pacearchaeota archaeon]|tara:strand:+ start:1220 stop:1399 length:180 start_codon:yes stop_codon:yes gene_type:complete